MQGRNPNLNNAITARAPYCGCGIPLGCIAGLAYLRANNLMTMNPQCSGGVPHRMYRGCRSSDPISGSSAKNPSGINITIVMNGRIVNPDDASVMIPTTVHNGFVTINWCNGVYNGSPFVGIPGFAAASSWFPIGPSGWYTVMAEINGVVLAATTSAFNLPSLYCLINCTQNHLILFQSFDNDLEPVFPDVAAIITENNLESLFS